MHTHPQNPSDSGDELRRRPHRSTKSYLRQVKSVDGVVLSSENIDKRCKEMGLRLAKLYEGKPFTIVAVLNGAMMFAVDLLKTLSDRDKFEEPVGLEAVKARSYHGTESGKLELDFSILKRSNIEGKHIVLVDDIWDTSATLFALTRELNGWGPASLRTLVLLKKQGTQKPKFKIEIDDLDIGFEIPNVFVVGRGLDYNDRYRNLTWVAEYVGPLESAKD